ncbi:hypothetical protein SAMN03080602_00104 [Arenibacter troitsensis]|uniref:Uncharacterized protein n=1 Tax=Arenibacter troitsensis TaxID=188872 RepID=A0A1X7HXA8_9FLAO|nr:hypothetical protein SAMN03080602_00104 [Arenibacter troitsensis]
MDHKKSQGLLTLHTHLISYLLLILHAEHTLAVLHHISSLQDHNPRQWP